MSNIVKGSGIIYTTGKPNTTPNENFDSEVAIDVSNGIKYIWNRTTNDWDGVAIMKTILVNLDNPFPGTTVSATFLLNTVTTTNTNFSVVRNGTGSYSLINTVDAPFTDPTVATVNIKYSDADVFVAKAKRLSDTTILINTYDNSVYSVMADLSGELTLEVRIYNV